jgi:hypothetical protein
MRTVICRHETKALACVTSERNFVHVRACVLADAYWISANATCKDTARALPLDNHPARTARHAVGICRTGEAAPRVDKASLFPEAAMFTGWPARRSRAAT